MYTDAGSFCAHITPDELEDISNKSRTATLKRGESIETEEMLTWPVIAISSGVISLQHLLEDGRKTIAAFFMRGDIIDMRGINSRNRGCLIALNKVNLCRLSPAVFENIIDTNPQAQRIAWNNLREQTYRAIDHSSDLAKKHALEKLVSFIFECKRRQTVTVSENMVIIPVRRVDLAEYLGMQPETVSRCFKDLADRGIIEFNGISNIKLLNIPALRRIANGDRDANGIHKTAQNKLKILSYG
ncbi:Crp/Fnr family transcriptional regulator [Profundibacter sp.]